MNLDLSSWDPDAAVASKRRRRAVSIGVQQMISFKEEAKGYRHYIVGGWPGYSAYIDPRMVPICRDHKHDPISEKIGMKLVKKAFMGSLLCRHCLTAQWQEWPAGAEVLVYGTLEAMKFDIFIREGVSP